MCNEFVTIHLLVKGEVILFIFARIFRIYPLIYISVVMCLMDGLRKTPDLISNECRRKLGERDRLWNMAHDKYKMALPENWLLNFYIFHQFL